MNCTIDASVFVAAVRVEEDNYTISRRFLQQVRAETVTVFCPTLVLPECAAAIARPTGDAALVEELTMLIESYPGLSLVALELPLARRAVQIATAHRLRGADSVYVAVAEAFDAPLITWDMEMLQRGPAVVPTHTPTEWVGRKRADR
ncbi:MAG: PIN domain-containing protein [Candidatus Latescibacteria bacterium]|nr:PIN domain-containing protein [Candidatus Latescibacterota bacterium]